MNICILATTYPRYAGDYLGSFIAGQAHALAQAGHTVHVIAPRDVTVDCLREEHDRGVHIHRFDYWFPRRWQALCYGAGIPENFRRNRLVALQVPALIMAFVWRALPLVRHCDVVHGHWSFGGLAALIVGGLAHKPVVVTVYGAEALSGVLRPLNRYIAERADGLIVISRFTRDVVRRYASSAIPKVIPFGVNPEKIAPPDFDQAAFRHASGTEPDDRVVLAVGRLVERKGFHVLVEAVSRLPDARKVRVFIGGSGPERQALQARIAAFNLADRVKLLGRLEDDELAKWYAAADVFVLPSIVDSTGDTEGLGMVLLEAIANGTPVIASRTGGITDIVRHNETGLLARPGDPDDLAAQLDKLPGDRQLYERLRVAAKRNLDERFSWETLTGSLCNLYESARSGRESRRQSS